MKPPGSAKAFGTSSSTTWKVNGNLASELRTRFWPEPVDELGDRRVLVQLRLPRHFLGQLLAERHLFLEGIEVDALADVAIADLIRIVLLLVGGVRGCERYAQDGRDRKRMAAPANQPMRIIGLFNVL